MMAEGTVEITPAAQEELAELLKVVDSLRERQWQAILDMSMLNLPWPEGLPKPEPVWWGE